MMSHLSDLTPVQREQLLQNLQVYEKHAQEMRHGRSRIFQSFDTLAKPKAYLKATKQNMDHTLLWSDLQTRSALRC